MRASPWSAPRGSAPRATSRTELGMGVVRTPKSSTRLFVANVEGGDLAEHVDDRALVVEEHHPPERVDPRFLRGRADGGPVLLAEGPHQGRVDRLLARLAQQHLHLARGAARRHLPPEAELAVARRRLELGMLAQVLEDLLVHLGLP